MSVPIYGFYHVCAINNYIPIVDEQLGKLFRSGLLAACTKLYVAVLHPTDIAFSIVEALIGRYNSHFKEPRIEVGYYSKNLHLYERPILTLTRTQAISYHNPNARVFYLHTKGVSDRHQTEEMIDRMNGWRRFMEAYTVTRWRDCVKILDTHDVCGVNFQPMPSPHFSGNMWWARSDYIGTLDPIGLIGPYSEPEQWVCSKQPRVYCFQHSGVNHFEEVFDVEHGIKPIEELVQPRVAVYTAIYGKYDPFQRHAKQSIKCGFFYFSDTAIAGDDRITLKDVEREDTPSPIMKAKHLRVHPFEIPELDNYDIIIYLDGNIRIGTSTFIEDLLKVVEVEKYPLTISRHPETGCAYQEAYHASTFPKYANTDLQRQTHDYQLDGFPRDYGFYCSGFLVWNRKFKEELVSFQAQWWEGICKYNKTSTAFPQCQMSLMYTLWKTNLNVLKLTQYCYTPKLMVMTEHARDGVAHSRVL